MKVEVTTTTTFRTILKTAYDHSWYAIRAGGVGLDEWMDGYTELMGKVGMGAPLQWVTTTGREVNALAENGGEFEIAPRDRFPDDLTILLFEYDHKDMGKLAMFKLRMQDRWFDDAIDSMRRGW